MAMFTLAENDVLWLIIGLAAGWVIAWLLRGRMMGNRIAMLRTKYRAKYEQLKRDLNGRIARLEDDRLNAEDLIPGRDTAVTEPDRLLRQQTEQLSDRAGQILHLMADRADQQTRLTKLEAAYATLQQDHRAARALIGNQNKRIADDGAKLAALDPVPARLTATEKKLAQTLKNLESAEALVDTQERDISRMHKRTV
ncbi:MAG: hypothetical protein ABIW48_09790 [Burkholderiales bacterium]